MTDFGSLRVDPGVKEPYYRQISRGLRELIRRGELAPGMRLPPTRSLSRLLGVNRHTVEAAYRELVSRDLLTSRVGRGTFVASERGRASGAPPRVSPPVLGSDDAPSPMTWEGLFAGPPGIEGRLARGLEPEATPPAGTINFAGYYPDEELAPAREFREALLRSVKSRGRALFRYADSSGYFPLRTLIAEELARRGVEAEPAQVVITTGSQQALYLVAKALLNPGDVVGLENPTYPGALAIFRSLRAKMEPVPLDEEGLELDRLEALLLRQRLKILYVMPDFQNPTGVTLNRERRERLLALAAAHAVPVVEDHYVQGLRYEGEDEPPLMALDRGGHTVYLGTLSKSVLPGFRVGWVVAPTPLASRLAALKRVIDINTSSLLQATVHHYLAGDRLSPHLTRARRVYEERRDALMETLQKHLPSGTRIHRPHGGLAVWVELPAGYRTEELYVLARREGVLIARGSLFFADGGGETAMRLSFSSTGEEKIRQGARILGRLAAGLRRDRDGPSGEGRERMPLV